MAFLPDKKTLEDAGYAGGQLILIKSRFINKICCRNKSKQNID